MSGRGETVAKLLCLWSNGRMPLNSKQSEHQQGHRAQPNRPHIFQNPVRKSHNSNSHTKNISIRISWRPISNAIQVKGNNSQLYICCRIHLHENFHINPSYEATGTSHREHQLILQDRQRLSCHPL